MSLEGFYLTKLKYMLFYIFTTNLPGGFIVNFNLLFFKRLSNEKNFLIINNNNAKNIRN